MEENKDLQPSRRVAITTLIERYKKLADDIFNTVGEDMPKFEDHEDEEGEVITSAEKKKYSFINVRKDALATANEMLFTVNELERELNDPNYNKNKAESKEEPGNNIHPSKRHSRTS